MQLSCIIKLFCICIVTLVCAHDNIPLHFPHVEPCFTSRDCTLPLLLLLLHLFSWTLHCFNFFFFLFSFLNVAPLLLVLFFSWTQCCVGFIYCDTMKIYFLHDPPPKKKIYFLQVKLLKTRLSLWDHFHFFWGVALLMCNWWHSISRGHSWEERNVQIWIRVLSRAGCSLFLLFFVCVFLVFCCCFVTDLWICFKTEISKSDVWISLVKWSG